MSEEEQGIEKRLILVALWCIQFNATCRPPMSEVIQMLEGDTYISTPPFPFLVDALITPMKLFVCDPSSSTTYYLSMTDLLQQYYLEVETKNLNSTHGA